MIFTIPFPKILQKITTTMAIKAKPQLLEQFSTADLERFKPIAMIIGPVTTGGKKRITFPAPKIRKAKARARYIRPARATPKHAYKRSSGSLFGAMLI